MDFVPLIPKNKHPENHDVSYVLREVFQDILSNPVFSKNVAKSVEKYNVDDENLKAIGRRVTELHNNTELCMNNFGSTEDDILISQGTYMKEKDIIDKNDILKANVKLKMKGLFIDLDVEKVNEYGLLQKLDLLPSKAERSMDFRMNSNRHRCPPPCPYPVNVRTVTAAKASRKISVPPDVQSPKLPELSADINAIMKKRREQQIVPTSFVEKEPADFKRDKKNRHRPCLTSYTTDLDVYPTKLPKSKGLRKHANLAVVKPHICSRRVFKAEPDIVIFEDYKPGITYEKTFKLRNITKSMQSFIPCILPRTSCFKVELQTGSTRIAPGMCVIFSVQYFTDIYQDVIETMSIKTYTACDVPVTLISRRPPPVLTAFVFKNLKQLYQKCSLNDDELEDDIYGKTKRAVALNSTIDCGSCLLGNKVELNLIIKNEGNYGSFFLINEDNWYSADISTVNTDMELITHSFHIHPTYFEINTNEFIELDITFFPRSFGLAAEKLFWLCSNNTLEEIDIVGDGVLFESNSVVIEAEPKEEYMLNLDAHSRYIIKYGKCVPYQKCKNTITVHNNSVVDFKYRWVIRESQCHVRGISLKKIDPSWITMKLDSNYLPGHSTCDFPLLLECQTVETGFYSIVLILYILDVPEASLIEEKTFYVIEELEDSVMTDEFAPKLVNIMIGEIEITCEVVPIHIKMDPGNITIPYTLNYQETFKQKIQLYTAGPTPLECEWNPIERDWVEICPVKFTLNPEILFICDLNIFANTYEDIQETATMVINHGVMEKKLNITAKVVKPMARFSENTLNFGFIPKRRMVPGKDLFVENMGQEKLYWEIFEFYYDHSCNALRELQDAKHLSQMFGELDKNESCKVTYNIDNVDQQHRWLSFLVLLSSHPQLEATNSLCLITYEVVQPEVIIHTKSSQQPILYPGRLLHVNCASFYTVCLHNVGTKLAASFIWGNTVGKQADCVMIKCHPKSGIIQPQSCVHITIAIEPVVAGVLDQVYVPCFVGNMDEPIMLTVLCVVENICLHFYLPGKGEDMQKVVWPPTIRADSDSLKLSFSHFGSEVSALKVDELYEILRDEALTTEKIYNTAVNTPEETLGEMCVEANESTTSGTSDISLYLEKMVKTKPISAVRSSFDSLQNYFGPDLIIQEHVVEFHNVPLRTPTKKTITFENLTPVLGHYSVEAINFYAVDETDESDYRCEKTLVKLNIIKKDEWESSINRSFGIVVKPKPETGDLEPCGTAEIEIWAYANTWGVYMEEIIIEINDISPFCFTLVIEAVGIPIEFPIAMNTKNNEPIVRFGSLPYLSKPCQRKLKITNFTCIPICLVWHVFIIQGPVKKRQPRKDPLNIIIDSNTNEGCLGMNRKQFMQVVVADEYYGKEDFSIFEVQPRKIDINSKSTGTITMTINTKQCKPRFTNTNIQANLVGFIHTDDEFTFQPNTYTRKKGIEISPAKVKLLVTLELPLLKLELVRGDKRIKAYANDIIAAQEMRYERVLVFRNVDNAPATVYMHTRAPFRVVSVRTAQTDTTEQEANAAIVHPGECVEVIVECTVDAEEILRYSDMLYNEKTTVFTELLDFKLNAITILRYLNIHQQGLRKQVSTLKLVIYYPQINISEKNIDFGTIFVGNTKKMLITLTNQTASAVPFIITKPLKQSVITITPMQGIIPRASGTTQSSIILNLYFIPTESQLYQESMQINTNIPFYYFNVELVGLGTNDEKFYSEGI